MDKFQTDLDCSHPTFFKWAFLNVRTIIFILLFLYLAYSSASYSFEGFG